MSRVFVLAVAGGAASGLLYLSLITGSSGAFILAYLTPLPLFVVGLGLGVGPSAIAGAVGAAMVLASGSLATAGLFILLMAAPVVVLVRHALLSRPATASGGIEWYPPGLLVSWLTAMALVILVIAALFLAGGEGGIEGAVGDNIRNLLRTVGVLGDVPERERVVEAIARFFLAAVLSSWCVMVAVNGVLAQGLLMRFGANLRPPPRMEEIEIPPWPAYALALAAAASFLSGDLGAVGRSAAILLCLPFFFLGLGVLHFAMRRWGGRMFLLVLVYLLVILLGWPAVVLAGIGIIEHFVALRRRLAGRGHGQENE